MAACRRFFGSLLQSSSNISKYYAQRSCSAVAQIDSEEPEAPSIPILIPDHVIKRLYIVNSHSQVYEADKISLWLTKSYLQNGELPEVFEHGVEMEQNKKDILMKHFHDSLLQTVGYQKFRPSRVMKYEEFASLGLVQDLMRLCWSHANHTESFLDNRPLIKAYWSRKFNFYQTKIHPDYVLRTAKPIPVFEQDVQSSLHKVLPGPYDNYSMGCYKRSVVHVQNYPGYKNGSLNKLPHSHTMVITSIQRKPEEVFYQGLIAMFTQLVSQAMDNGYMMGQHLKKPLVTKCVVFQDLEMTFMCFQLNTLSLQDESGIKNLVWSTTMPIFNQGVRETYGNHIVFEKLRLSEGIEINKKCLETLLSFLSQKTE